MNNMTKALVLLRSLGERASTVLTQLPADVSQRLSERLSVEAKTLPAISSELVQEILAKSESIKNSQRQPVKIEKPQVDPMKQLASKLSEERPQTIAFYVSNLEEADRAKVLQYLPFTLQEAVKKCTVATIPISKQAFETLSARN